MSYKVIFMLLILSSCSDGIKHKYQFSNGDVTSCDQGVMYNCGAGVENCDNNKSYWCQLNVVELK
jgi:hypothetical protein